MTTRGLDPTIEEAAAVSPSPDRPARKGRWGLVLRLTVSVLLLAWVIGGADWSKVLDLVQQAEMLWLVLFVLFTPLQVGISVAKWRTILRACGHRVRFWSLYGIFVVSQFYNNLLPSSVGGDVVRAVMLSRRVNDPRQAWASIVVERFTGLLVLVLMAVVAVLVVPGMREKFWLVAAVAAVGVLCLGVLACVVVPQVVWLARAMLGRRKLAARLIDKAEKFQRAIRALAGSPTVMGTALVWSLAFHVSAAISIYLACRGIGEDVSIVDMLLTVPVVLTVATLPISISGIGLAEWAFMDSFAAVGLDPNIGLVAALLLRAKGLIWSSAGYLTYTLATSGSGRASVQPDEVAQVQEQAAGDSPLASGQDAR